MISSELIFTTNSPDETLNLSYKLATKIQDSRLTVCISGQLGAGKSLFCRGIISLLTNTKPELILSPTFNYLNIYEAQTPICHFDFYRFHNYNELYKFGFEDYLESHLCLIEWPERILPFIPEDAIWVNISTVNENSRTFKITGIYLDEAHSF